LLADICEPLAGGGAGRGPGGAGMTGKMSMAGSQDEVLKQSWMTKRSQLKSR
jgi:hypothetical protein